MYSKVLSVKGHLFLKTDLTFVAFSARHHLAKHLEVAHAKKKKRVLLTSLVTSICQHTNPTHLSVEPAEMWQG